METQPREISVATSKLSLAIIVVIAVVAFLGVALSLLYPNIVNLISGTNYVSGGALYDSVFVILTFAAEALYLFGGAIITYGAILVTYHFIQYKLSDPYKPTYSTRILSGYLTLSLNFFIGAEIIRTVAVRSYEEVFLLILVIFSRGLFSLILYLERRWHGTTETE